MPRSLDRRTFLRAAGVSLALPALDGPWPGGGRAEDSDERPIQRLVCVGNPFGMYAPAFFPAQAGADYEVPALLEPLAEHRGQLTVFSHLDHRVGGGHAGARAFLSGVRPVHAAAMSDRNVTIDQVAAQFVGTRTRYPVLNLAVGGSWQMCWTRDAVAVPPIVGPRRAFEELFVDEGPEAAAQNAARLAQGRSILDAVREQSSGFARRLTFGDRAKLDEYATSVRQVEQKLTELEGWLDVPKPSVEMAEPKAGSQAEQLPLVFELIALALQTDSTRVATLEITGAGLAAALKLKGSYHKYSHHGKQQGAIDGLLRIERLQMVALAGFLRRLAETPDDLNGGTLLDHTMVLYGSGLGNGNSHSCSDLPILVAGGGLRHAGHLAFPEEARQRVPLCNLYVTLLRHFGLELESFGPSTGSLAEIEP